MVCNIDRCRTYTHCIVFFCIEFFSSKHLYCPFGCGHHISKTRITQQWDTDQCNNNASFFVTHATDAAENVGFQTKDNIYCNTYLSLVHCTCV